MSETVNPVKFIEALGINPRTVRADVPIQIEFSNGTPIVKFGLVIGVLPGDLTRALDIATVAPEAPGPLVTIEENEPTEGGEGA